METLHQLAALLKQRAPIDAQIANLLGVPADTGSIGEYIAARIFGIDLNLSRSEKAHDGYFQRGQLAGQRVNVKCYLSFTRHLDIDPENIPDYYLVLTADLQTGKPALERPLIIQSVFLFHAQTLIAELDRRRQQKQKTLMLNEATYVHADLWQSAQIYPIQQHSLLPVEEKERQLLKLFSAVADPK